MLRRVARVSTAILITATLQLAAPVSADEAPTRWEQLFFPFPIVGAPPQLEQQASSAIQCIATPTS